MPFSKKEDIKNIFQRLEEGVKNLYTSEKYKNYLSVMSKFHSYSYNNCLLIALQKRDATHVAGYQTWKSLKRVVNKGEKGIQILAPCTYTKKQEIQTIDSSGRKKVEEKEVTNVYFKPVYVFDISQTSGEELPKLATELTSTVENYDRLIQSVISSTNFTIKFEAISTGAKGYCDTKNKLIVVKEDMSQSQTLKTLIHEITHADLHATPSTVLEQKDRNTKEVEAESTAYIVCNYYNIDTSEYSFSYIADWSKSKDLNELKSSLDTIQKQSFDLISRIDSNFKNLNLSKKHNISIDNKIIQAKEKSSAIIKKEKSKHIQRSIGER